MQSHPLTNFEMQKYCQIECKFNGSYFRNNFPKINDMPYAINFGEFKSIGTHWVALYVNVNDIVCFDSFWAEHVPKEIKKKS